MRKMIVCAAAVMILVAVAEAVGPPQPKSEVFGRCTEVIHPGRPGARTTRSPMANVKVVAHAGDRVMAKAVSDADGRFRLRLPPGKYRISFDSPTQFDNPQPDISVELHADIRKEIAAAFHINLK